MIDVSIIIVNYKTSALINNCIRSIYDHTRECSFEIIIVDNNTEDLSKVIAEAGRPEVKMIQLPENVGFGLANNAGFKIAKGRNLFCLNPDTLLLNNAVKILSDYLDSHKECGGCGGNLFDGDMHPALSFRRMLPGIRWELNELTHLTIDKILYGKNYRFNHSDKPIDVAYITGADLMMPKEIVKATGGFSDEFFMYYEETDLCARIHQLGKSIVSVPSARIQHIEGKSFDASDLNNARLQRAETGRRVYYKRNVGKVESIFADLIHKTFLRVRALIHKIKK